jgi:multidrug resistance efflux pump
MPTPFSNTTHALNNDPYHHLTRWGMMVALIIMLMWVLWFIWGDIHHYVSSQSATITQDEQPVWRIPTGKNISTAYTRYTIVAKFSANDIARIHKGQDAALYFASHSTLPSRPIISTIDSVDQKKGQVHLRFEVKQSKNDVSAQTYQQAPRVEVSVLRESPAAFLFHTVTHNNTANTVSHP